MATLQPNLHLAIVETTRVGVMKQDEMLDSFLLAQPSPEIERFLKSDLRAVLESAAAESASEGVPVKLGVPRRGRKSQA